MSTSTTHSIHEAPEPPRRAFQRSYSRVFYESEYTTPTSWEFCGILPAPEVGRASGRNSFTHRVVTPPHPHQSFHQSQSSSPMLNPAHLSLLRSSQLSSEHSPLGDLHSDASRNSTGSSTGSHKSQDSGFSDSGETRRQQQLALLQASIHSLHETTPSSRKHQSLNHSRNVNQNGSFCSATFKDSQVVQQGSVNENQSYHHDYQHSGCDNFNHYHDLHLSLPVPPLPTTQVPVSVVVNGAPACLSSSSRNCSKELNTDYANGNSSYQEIILSRSAHQGIVGPLPSTDQNGVIGAPTFCSTPKKSVSSPTFTPSKMTVMQKIDNFESLNKNVNVSKGLDNNNNASLGGGNSFNSASETRSSFFSRPPSRIPTPPPITPPTKNVGPTKLDTTATSHSSADKSLSYATIISNHSNRRDSNGNAIPSNCKSSRASQQQDEELEESLFSFCRISPKLVDVSNYSGSSQMKPPKTNGTTWQSLPKGFKRIYVREDPSKELIVKSQFDNENNDALRLWFHELRGHTEPECFHALQMKDLNYSSYYCNDSMVSINFNNSIETHHQLLQGNWNQNIASSAPVHLVSASILSIRSVERTSSIISSEFSRICKYLEFKLHIQVPPIIFSLLESIEEFLIHLKDSYGYHTKLESHLASACLELRTSTLKFCEDVKKESRALDASRRSSKGSKSDSPYLSAMMDGVVSIGNQFSKVVDQRLTKDLSTILDIIENGGFGARMALESFSIVLYDGGAHLCRLAAHLRTVRGLLSCIIDTKDENEQILALRCLATVLCIGEAVRDFDNAGGFEIIADILHDSGFGLNVKFEAVAVLTQVTDPWIDLEATLCNLGAHLEKIVVSLTNLVHLYASETDSFLLVVAAISNLTFLELSSIDLLKMHGTIQLIISAVQQKADNYSVFIMDHVSTILTNMAGIERCRSEVVQAGGITMLLYFLRRSPSPFDSIPEITACERLQQKSTIAISRLASENGVPELVLKLGGIQRLVQLSKEEKERNYSDGVLIACLATLRKLVSVCGNDLIHQLHAEDLIYPRLLDSFLLFSSRQESCV